MESHSFRFEHPYAGGVYKVLFASDTHIDESGFNRQMFDNEFSDAVADGRRILLNGDVFGAILPQDIKRYARGSDRHDVDSTINAIIEEVEAVLTPYVNHIDMIGCGNHETAVLKHHAIDVTRLLIGFLNRKRDASLPPIKHGGYSGFIRLIGVEESGGHAKQYVIYYNHGQGGTAEMTDGIIDAKRRQYTRSDCIWLGHKHRRWAHEIEPEIGVDIHGDLYEKKRHAIMTGSYLKNAGITDAGKDGYRLSYPEQFMRTPQGTGGIKANFYFDRDGVKPEFIL